MNLNRIPSEMIKDDFFADIRDYVIDRRLAIMLPHNPKYAKFANDLISKWGKLAPEVCLSEPKGGVTTITSEGATILMCPWPIRCSISLGILAHETGHFYQYKNPDLMMSKPQWLVELEAEIYMMRYFKENNLTISKEWMVDTKNYIGQYINCDISKGEVMNMKGHSYNKVPYQQVDKNIVKEWIRNPYFTDEIINLVPVENKC
jgi:hypothetical protein